MRTKRAEAGFTMMELLVSLFLVVIILAIAAVSLDTVSDESRLRQPAAELRSFAKKAVKSAVAEQRSYSIFFHPRHFLMRERFPVGLLPEEEDPQAPAPSGFADQGQEEEATVVIYRHDLGDEVGMEVRRWNVQDWVVPDGIEWVFEPSGLCEPLSVRFHRRDGYVEIDFNPLTAGVQDERLYIP